MGKSEGSVPQETWHGHVTALTVAPEYRRLGLGAKMMNILEEVSDRLVHKLMLASVAIDELLKEYPCDNCIPMDCTHTVDMPTKISLVSISSAN